MILWTIQDIAVWERLQATGSCSTPSEKITFPTNEDNDRYHANYAYRWMAKQMTERLGPPPKDIAYPVWAWYKQPNRHDGKPDMRASHYVKGHRCIRIKLDIPDWKVLLSDFDDWHCALSYSYCALNEKDGNAFESWLKKLGVDYCDISDWSRTSPELGLVRNRVEKSWQRILGVSQQSENWGLPWAMRAIQATFWTIDLENVVSVEYFVSR